ncbi:uncharacterized protein EDB91DRAFT_132640 [Suillus paluster]|uniref:uncharacterized protein n=1 Tax=Suillus paluster TaxID=48578 RepID=UPI001B863428|nr:uncharacterized protein EDB91DRAFT_132640 [Suillus paluster]KAG1745932.1 hypothetical protein EDB91DRAFT_132640 [Suillus paluster]
MSTTTSNFLVFIAPCTSRRACTFLHSHWELYPLGTNNSNTGMGAMDKESSMKLLDAYYDAGGNLIDTANNYQDESSGNHRRVGGKARYS